MKKLISAFLILVLVLSIGALAYADNDALVITKDPTDKVRTAGDTAFFTSVFSPATQLFLSCKAGSGFHRQRHLHSCAICSIIPEQKHSV